MGLDPMFHALTGCGKKTAWSTWDTLPELTSALLRLSCAPSDMPGI